MTERDTDDEVAVTYESQLLEHARRQTKAQETVVLLLEIWLFLCVLAAVIGGISVLGS